MIQKSAVIGAAKSQWRQGQMFLAALLLALASAIIPALFPSGMPSTRIAGSAFDPTTSAVALRSREQAIVRAATFDDQDKLPAAVNAPALLTKAPHATLLGSVRHPGADAATMPSPRPDARRITSAQARAPPSR